MEDEERFEGFVPPVSNFFKMPNEWINICSRIKSLAELKVVQYVLRHTWGWQEYDGKPKPITTDEFMYGRKDRHGNRMDNGTGLSNHSVIDGLVRAVEHGYLIVHTDDSDKARIEKSYALKMTGSGMDVKKVHSENSYEDSSQPAMKKVHSRVKNLHSDCEESSQRSEKDTNRKTAKKDRGKKENDPPFLSPIYEAYDFCIINLNIVPTGYHTPQTSENDRAMQMLADQGATRETLLRVIKSLHDDPDTFYRKNINPAFVAKHYAARIGSGAQSSNSDGANKPISLAERNRMNREKYGVGK